jgi:hypothetical protein
MDIKRWRQEKIKEDATSESIEKRVTRGGKWAMK